MSQKSSPELTPVGHALLAELEAELPLLEEAMRKAEARYFEKKPEYDQSRRACPQVAEQEVREIRAIGSQPERIEQVRERIAWLRRP